MIRIIISLLILFTTISSSSQHMAANQYHFNAELRNYASSFLYNPSFYLHQPDSTYSDISLLVSNSKAKGLYNIQEGNKHTIYTFNAESLQKKDHSAFWGAALYSNQQHDNISWSTTTDFKKIQPYVIADLIRGKSYEEFYFFKGGYAKHFNKLTFGIEAQYRTGISYRKLDPRPQSNISDLYISSGITTHIGKHILGVNYSYNNYTQEHDVRVYRPGSGYQVYYLRGMGISEIRFSTSITDHDALSNTYESDSHGLGIQLSPNNNNGLSFALSAKKTQLELQYNQGIALKIVNQLDSYELNAETTYLSSTDKRNLRIKLFGTAVFQNGFDYNYERGSFTLIGKPQKKYENNTIESGISILTSSHINNRKTFFIDGCTHASYNKEEYFINLTAPPAFQKFTNWTTSVSIGFNNEFKKTALSVKLHSSYRYGINSTLQTSSDAVDTANETLVIPYFQYLSVNKLAIAPEVRYDYDLKNRYGLYLKAQHLTEIYEHGEAFNGRSIAIGLTL